MLATTLEVLAIIGVLIAGLSILVVIHELGHFIPAKLFGMRVEKFYLFFDWPRKLFSVNYKGTEYGVGMLPLGGYVKISGIIDESFDTQHVNQPVQPWEFRAKPLWQRMIVMVGGVTMNVLLGIVIFSALKYNSGDVKVPMKSLAYGVRVLPGTVGEEIGFKDGDKVLRYREQDIQYFPGGSETINYLMDTDGYFEVRRNDQTVKLDIPNDILKRLKQGNKEKGEQKLEPILFVPNGPAVFEKVLESGAGGKAGLKPKDQLLRINNDSVVSFAAIRPILQQHKNQEVKLLVQRGAERITMPCQLDSNGILGVQPDLSFLERDTIRYSLLGAIVPGTSSAFNTITNQVQGFKKMATGDVEIKKSVAGPVKIAKLLYDFVKEMGWAGFFYGVALLSMVLAFMNILPIPALDGGHVVFLLLEGFTGKEPSVKVRLAAQNVGFFLLIGLMVFVLFNDFFN
jgi:regulator of sigma E protease